MKLKRPQKNIFVSIGFGIASARDFFSGILRYVSTHPEWNLRIFDGAQTFDAQYVQSEKADGVIMASAADIDIATIARKGLPVVWWSESPMHNTPISCVTPDHTDIGALGARYFLGRGKFNSFSFVGGSRNAGYCAMRREGFRKELLKTGIPAKHISAKTIENEDDDHKFALWLKAVPKPLAIMAANDRLAAKINAICKANEIVIPEQASILGVDDDEFYCTHAHPMLSSIKVAHDELGYAAAAEIDRLSDRRKVSPKPRLLIGCRAEIVERESTKHISPSALLVRRANTFIKKNALQGINAADVVTHLGVSRRLVEMRYKQQTGKTIHAALSEIRLSEVQRLLSESSYSIVKIAQRTGFRDPNHLTHIFKRHYGITMRQYRQQARDKITPQSEVRTDRGSFRIRCLLSHYSAP